MRRGSLKSRIFQLSKRRRKEKHEATTSNPVEDNNGRTCNSKTPPNGTPLVSQTAQGVQTPVLSTRSFNHGGKVTPPSGHSLLPRAAQDLKRAPNGQGNGQGVTHKGPVNERNGQIGSHGKTAHEVPITRTSPKHSPSPFRCELGASHETPQEDTIQSCEVNSLYAEAPKKRTHTPSTATSDTTSAVPSPFRVPPSPENAKPLPSPPQVVLRTKVRKAPHQAGHLLHSAISRHFRHLHCTRVPPHLKDSPVSVEVSANLEQYITDLFHQLDPLGQGYVTREDFDALCEVLGITNVTQGRNSIEWLSSYKPRPHTPGSPLRLDRLGEARYPGVRVANNGPPPSFLWTQGPRPFWELWSARKSRRKQLNLDEFLERLLEQWAVSHGYPVQEARRLLRSKALQAAPKISEDTAKGNNVFLDKKQHDRSRLDILQRVRRGRLPTNRVNQTNGIAANRGKRMFYSDSEHRNGNGIGQNGFANGNLPHQPTQPSATRKLSRFFLRSRKDQLEQQLVEQKEEIDSLKTVVNELRSSLQLSDAQNLALQVVLKRMDKAEAQLPSSEYKVKMRKSEKQLENLITELKEMSQTKYPTLPSQNYSTSSSSHDPETELSTTQVILYRETIVSALSHQVYLSSVQKELRDIACRLSQSPDVTFEDLSLTEAFDALVEAQLEIEKMR